MSFLRKLFSAEVAQSPAIADDSRLQAELAATQEELSATKAQLEELANAPAPEPQTIEVAVPVERLTGIRIGFGTAKNTISANDYESRWVGKTVSELVRAMFSGVDMGTVSSATFTYQNRRSESVELTATLGKEMPMQIVVNTVLGEGGAA